MNGRDENNQESWEWFYMMIIRGLEQSGEHIQVHLLRIELIFKGIVESVC